MLFKACVLTFLKHLKDTWALGHSRHLDTCALRDLGSRTLKGHLGTQALRHSSTWAPEAKGKILYFFETISFSKLIYIFPMVKIQIEPTADVCVTSIVAHRSHRNFHC